ncbi:sugar phosphate isomerase/epimerase [Rhizobium sp. PP-F2F-G38]|nr:sugar phosphate isomerase/epimerase [Rhizobium sp. PP-WC-1G-195]PYF00689.1 sugar phosphate isomerase/epimerase [Rhizobium sp. PP-F2F-G38]
MRPLSFQLYSARNFPPLSDALHIVAKAGYGQVEGYGALYGDHDDSAVKALKADLDRNGLTMPTGHFSLDMLESHPERAIEVAKILGIETIYCPYVLPENRPTDAAGWKAFGARLQKAGETVRAAGLGFGWHNHDFELAALPDGTVPMDLIFEGGPDLEWEADIAWVIRGGADPLAWIDRYADRITAVHVKDIAPAGENTDEDGWADVGHGTVDWKGLYARLASTPAKTYIVEHDNPSDLARLAERSIASIKTF